MAMVRAAGPRGRGTPNVASMAAETTVPGSAARWAEFACGDAGLFPTSGPSVPDFRGEEVPS